MDSNQNYSSIRLFHAYDSGMRIFSRDTDEAIPTESMDEYYKDTFREVYRNPQTGEPVKFRNYRSPNGPSGDMAWPTGTTTGEWYGTELYGVFGELLLANGNPESTTPAINEDVLRGPVQVGHLVGGPAPPDDEEEQGDDRDQSEDLTGGGDPDARPVGPGGSGGGSVGLWNDPMVGNPYDPKGPPGGWRDLIRGDPPEDRGGGEGSSSHAVLPDPLLGGWTDLILWGPNGLGPEPVAKSASGHGSAIVPDSITRQAALSQPGVDLQGVGVFRDLVAPIPGNPVAELHRIDDPCEALRKKIIELVNWLKGAIPKWNDESKDPSTGRRRGGAYGNDPGGVRLSKKKGGGLTKQAGHRRKIESKQNELANKIREYNNLKCRPPVPEQYAGLASADLEPYHPELEPKPKPSPKPRPMPMDEPIFPVTPLPPLIPPVMPPMPIPMPAPMPMPLPIPL